MIYIEQTFYGPSKYFKIFWFEGQEGILAIFANPELYREFGACCKWKGEQVSILF